MQGFFFWDFYERILRTAGGHTPFHRAEAELLGGTASHEFIGELVLEKSGIPAHLVEAVGLHHATGDSPPPLVALIHVANNVANAIGLSYAEGGEAVEYQPGALRTLKLRRDVVSQLVDSLGPTVVNEVKQLVKRCTQ